MREPYHDAATRFKKANPVPDPAKLRLEPVDQLVDRAPVDVLEVVRPTLRPSHTRSLALRRVCVAAAAVVVVAIVAAALTRGQHTEVDVSAQVTSTVVVPSSVETLPAPEPEWANLPAWASGSAGPGRFRSLFFEPALRLELGPAWVTTEEGSNTTGTMRPLVWSEAEAFSAIYFYSHHNLDDTVVEEPPTAQELIERIDNHESTTNVSLTAVQIGGVPATKVEFDLTGNLLYIRTRGADRSNLLHDFETSSEIAIYVLEVRDNTVSIVLESQAPSKLDDLEKRAQPVLDSIVWRDPSS